MVFSVVVAKGVPLEPAMEVVNDTFLAVLRNPDRYDGRAKFSTWICSIAKNKAVDWHRVNENKVAHASTDDEESQQLQDVNVDLLMEVEKIQLQQALQRCLEMLSNEHRSVTDLFYRENESLEDISNAMELPLGTVKSRLHYAKNIIISCMQKICHLGGPK